MKFEDVKHSIEDSSISHDFMILQYEDVPFVANQWVRAIAECHKESVQYLDSIDSLTRDFVDIFGTKTISSGLRVYECDTLDITTDKLKSEVDLIIVVKKIEKTTKDIYQDYICTLPKLEGWHIKDYVYSVAKGVSEKDLDWFIKVCNNDIYRIENELDKLRIFEPNERKYVFNDMKYDGAFRDLSTFNVFNITNAVTSRDYETLVNALKEIRSFDAEPLGVVTLLYQGFKKLISVWLAANPTPENTGLKSNVIYAIKNSPRVFTKTQLLKSFQFLNSIDKMLKTGQLCDMEDLIDFVICKVLTV